MLIPSKLRKIYKKPRLFLEALYLITTSILHTATCVMRQCSYISPVCLINSSLYKTWSYSCIYGYIEIPLKNDIILLLSSKTICLRKKQMKKTKYIFISIEKSIVKKNDNNSK